MDSDSSYNNCLKYIKTNTDDYYKATIKTFWGSLLNTVTPKRHKCYCIKQNIAQIARPVLAVAIYTKSTHQSVIGVVNTTKEHHICQTSAPLA